MRKPQSDVREDWSAWEQWWHFPLGGKPETRDEWFAYVLAWLGLLTAARWVTNLSDWLGGVLFGW